MVVERTSRESARATVVRREGYRAEAAEAVNAAKPVEC